VSFESKNGNGNELSHSEIRRLLHSGEENQPEWQPVLQAHLAGCADCRAYAAFTRLLERELPERVPVPLFSEQQLRQRARLVHEGVRKQQKRAPILQGMRLVSWAATMAVLVLGIGWIVNSLLPPVAGPGLATPGVTENVLQATLPVTATLAPETPPQPGPTGGGYTYLPGAGFVDMNSRVLGAPVSQANGAERVIVIQGVADANRTRLWLKFEGRAALMEGATLITPADQILPLQNWETPSNGEVTGGYLEFAGLPEGVSEATLALAEGWRIPVRFESAEGTGYTAISPVAPACQEIAGVRLCALAAARVNGRPEVQVQVEALNPGEEILLPLQDFSQAYGEDRLALQAEDGQIAGLLQGPGTIPMGRRASWHVLPGQPEVDVVYFEALAGDPVSATLHVPAVALRVPLSDTLSIDLGSNPQPGDTIDVNWTINAGGASATFRQGTLVGDGATTLRLELNSDPLENSRRQVRFFDMGRPQGLQGSYGGGKEGDIVKIFFELINPDGTTASGPVSVPVMAAEVTVVGPFDLPLTLSPQAGEVSAEPVEAGAFNAPPTPTPLALDIYSFSGRGLNAGEVLFAIQEGENSVLYAASPTNGFAPEVIAALPGLVYEVWPHTDRLGLDYLTGAGTVDGVVQDARLYTLRLDGSPPRELLGPLPLVDMAYPSADGRFLFYTSRRSMVDNPERFLLDLAACREPGAICENLVKPFPAELDGYSLGWPVWSPSGSRIALSGMPLDANGVGEVFLLDVLEDDTVANFTNFTNTPQHAESFPPAWLPDGSGLVYVQENLGPGGRVNDFDVIRHPLNGTPQKLATANQAPVPLTVSPNGGQIVYNHYLNKTGGQELVAIDAATGQSAPLAEAAWVEERAYSPDGRWLMYLSQAERQPGEAFAIELATGAQSPLGAGLGGPVAWAGWVK